jgi:hypothetical protein
MTNTWNTNNGDFNGVEGNDRDRGVCMTITLEVITTFRNRTMLMLNAKIERHTPAK